MIRKATLEDIDWILKECVEFAKTYPRRIDFAGNEQYARGFLRTIILNHLFLIAEAEGIRAGFIAGIIGPHHFNPDIRQLTELLWWVTPEYRDTGAGTILLDEFISFGRNTCDLISFTMEVNTPIGDEVLERRGFKLTEKAFVMECVEWQR